MTSDVLVKEEGALLQHGKDSDRVYLMKLGVGDANRVLDRVEALVRKHGYTRVVAKIPESRFPAFETRGFAREAVIPGFYKGTETGLFVGRYYSAERAEIRNAEVVEQVLETARSKAGQACSVLPGHMVVEEQLECNAEEMASLYDKVFDNYPFPIMDPAFLRQMMNNDVAYFGVRDQGRLIALTAAEMDVKSGNVEMTDMATLPEYRGYGLAGTLLEHMERYVRKKGLSCAYTIARAVEYGVNIIFARCGYIHAGTLANNTCIGGGLESMNVWYKPLL